MQAGHDCRIFFNLLQRVEPYIGKVKGKRILDVGCGIRAPFTLLFHSLEAKAVGIDVDILTRGFNLAKYRRILVTQGYERFLMRLMSDCYYDKFYYRELESKTGIRLNFNGVDLEEMDACHTAFEEEFDLIVSNAAFEHIGNVGETLKEIKRIMKPKALLHVEIHLFPSLTGGHNVFWSNPDSKQVVLGKMPPWDHLRKQQYPIDTSLNRLRERDYYQLFSNNFKIIDWVTEYEEPENFLTPEISLELSEYQKEELLKRAIVVLACKTP
jgi:SAM-dependent methyltransferase